MSKEMEVLEHIRHSYIKTIQMEAQRDGWRKQDLDNVINLIERDLKLIEQALTPPTVEEICEECNKYFKSIHWQNTVEWYERGQEFSIRANRKHYAPISAKQTTELSLFPPKIQNMFTKFFMNELENNDN